MPPQRRRRPVDHSDSEEDQPPRQRRIQHELEGQSDDDDPNDETMDGSGASSGDQLLAKKMVRYALSCEYSRTPIRRDGIKEKVLGNQGRAFKRIFGLAQTQLRAVWGMELRELPVREKMSMQEKRQAMKSKTQQKSGSGAFILSSTLPKSYKSATVIRPSKAPSAEDEAIYMAFYTLVVSLIWLSGGELTEQKLKRTLLRLNADRNVGSEKTEVTLKRMERHGYVTKQVDRPPVGQDSENTITWHVGPRAKEEIGLDGVMGMVREVYGGLDEDLEDKLRLSLGIKDDAVEENREEMVVEQDDE